MTEPRDVRLKRLHMRSIRRGIKEMDIVLTKFSEMELADLTDEELDTYEALLHENDHDLYQWVTDQAPAPSAFSSLISKVKRTLLNS